MGRRKQITGNRFRSVTGSSIQDAAIGGQRGWALERALCTNGARLTETVIMQMGSAGSWFGPRRDRKEIVMNGQRWCVLTAVAAWGVVLGLTAGGCDILAAETRGTTRLYFDNTGAEEGVTTPGAATFSVAGSNWTGGVVATEGLPQLYASGVYGYEVRGGVARVWFDTPVSSVLFFYVHGVIVGQGTATAYDDQGQVLGTVTSLPATDFAATASFVQMKYDTPIAEIEFTSGVIDNFSYPPAE